MRSLKSFTDVILRCNVVRKIVVQNETEKAIQERQVNLLVYLRQDRLHHDNTFSFACLPDICQVIDALAPLVDQQWGRLSVSGFDPCREQSSFISSMNDPQG